MAIFAQTTSSPALFSRLDGFAERLAASYLQWRLYHRTLSELRAIDTRELNDLGLDQYRLKETAWEAVYGAQD